MQDQDLQKQINDQIRDELKEHRELFASHQKHLQIANEEMGVVKTDMGIIKNDIKWMKDTFGRFEKSLEKMDSRGWWILGTVALGIAAQILITLLRN